ncbi:MAG: class I SAM-dependent methyltransferase [Gemmatimonadaceae bacterium]|nr:class I SAM-dependent methyltransferase [Gemmatimonadaceae bacterium]
MNDGLDRAYYDRWYRHPRHKVSTPAERARVARTIISVAEQLLERRVRNALDVGCGEGLWRAALLSVRPLLRYHGIDPSAYAVRRFGARRNLRRGDITSLDTLRLRGPFDIIICNDVLHYVPTPELHAGMRALAERLCGVAYLGLFTSADDIEGDTKTFLRRTPSFYRSAFARAGLESVGMHCWIPAALAKDRAALELSDA